MRMSIDESEKVKKGGGGGGKPKELKEGPSEPAATPKKRKEKISPSAAHPKMQKQHDRKQKTPTPSAREGSESGTQSDVSLRKTIMFAMRSTSSFDAYTKAMIDSFVERISKEYTTNADMMNKVVATLAEVCKWMKFFFDKLIGSTTAFMENFQTTFNSNTTAANEALKSLVSLFKTEKTKLQEIHTDLKTDHEAFQTSISSKILKLQEELAKESDLKPVMQSCITDVTGMLSDIIETSVNKKQGGEGMFGESPKEEPKMLVKSVVKQEPKGKETLFSNEPIINDDEEEDPDEEELKI
ncbi:unnamed protein product [Lactuca saligna]|uniref:Uncharacterized protein n=1 Tax=Lactuca saligna TaxID=75948 RepID=A0AA35Y323_LACSI|nr:unnamed protein product [Lactuca saligna]